MPRWVLWVWITLALLAILWLLGQVVPILIVVALGLLVAAALSPVVDWLVARRVPPDLAVVLCFAGLLGLLATFVGFVAPVLITQGKQLAMALPEAGERLSWLEAHWSLLRQQFEWVPRLADLSGSLSGHLAGAAQRLIGLTGQFVAAMLGVFTVLYLGFFFLKDGGRLREEALGLLPESARPEARGVLERIHRRVGQYVLGQFVVMSIVGLLSGLGLAILGVPYAALLGLLVGLLDIVPFVGPIAGAVPGVLLATSISWTTGLWAIGIYWLVQSLESYIFYPAVVGRAVRLHPIWVLLALLVGGSLLGLAGAALAVPTAATLQILIDEIYRPWLARRVRRVQPAAGD